MLENGRQPAAAKAVAAAASSFGEPILRHVMMAARARHANARRL